MRKEQAAGDGGCSGEGSEELTPFGSTFDASVESFDQVCRFRHVGSPVTTRQNWVHEQKLCPPDLFRCRGTPVSKNGASLTQTAIFG